MLSIINQMIFGVCGFQSAGKDSVAEILVKNFGFTKLSFASALKDVLSIIFSWPRDKLEGLTQEDRIWRETVDVWWAKELNMPQLSPRFAMTHFGTEIFRNHFHQDIWLKIVEKQLGNHDKIVVTDCRFVNEIELVKKYGGKIIHVHKNLPHWFTDYKNESLLDEKIKNIVSNIHISELSWIKCKFDYEIENNSTLVELQEKLTNFLK